MRFSLFFLLNLVLVGHAAAQARPDVNSVFGGYLTLPLEVPFVDTRSLNERLGAAGLPACRLPAVVPGIGFHLQLGRTVLVFSFNKGTREPDSDTAALAVEYRATTFGVGYDVLRRPEQSLFPYIGFKGSGVSYLFDEKARNPTTFGNYLQTPLNHKEITNSRGHLDLGLGASYQQFWLISLRAGVLVPLEAVRWNINNNKLSLSDSPGISYGGYVVLAIGLGNNSGAQQVKK